MTAQYLILWQSLLLALSLFLNVREQQANRKLRKRFNNQRALLLAHKVALKACRTGQRKRDQKGRYMPEQPMDLPQVIPPTGLLKINGDSFNG